MKKRTAVWFILIVLLLCIPSVLANDETVKGQQTTLWSDILNGSTYYSATSANITIYYPNGTPSIISQSMFLLATGRYTYNYTPNSTGIYYTYTTFQDSTGLVATATSTFYVQEESELYLAILFGLLALIILCFWYARSMANQPKTQVNVWILNEVTTKDFAVIFDLIGAFLILPLISLLNIWATGTQYAPIFASIYTAGFYFIGFTIFGYLVFYLVYRYNEGIENIHDSAYGKRRQR